MAAQGHDPAAGTAHVAEQRLQDRRGADVLHADGVLGPAHRVDERVVRSRPEFDVSGSADPGERLRRDAARPPRTISGVYREKCRLSIWNTQRGCCNSRPLVPSRGGSAWAAAHRSWGRFSWSWRTAFWSFRLRAVCGLGVPAAAAARITRPGKPSCGRSCGARGSRPGEQPVQVLGVAEVLGDDRGRVGIGDHVVAEVLSRSPGRS